MQKSAIEMTAPQPARLDIFWRRPRSVSRWTWLDVLLVAAIFIAYTVTLTVARRDSLPVAMAGAVANTLPVIIFGVPTRRIIRAHLFQATFAVQIAGNVLLCAAFSLLSYWLLIVFLGVINSPSPMSFIVQSMITSGMAWQMLENVTTYAAVAALAYARAYADRLSVVTAQLRDAPVEVAGQAEVQAPSRFLVRIGEELRPLDPATIISLTGADDYAELATVEGKRLVSMTLAEFEQRLDPARFIRVHRSRIVNLDFVDRAEPAGSGRLLLHMNNGEVIATSRSGAQALKSRAI